MQPQQFLDNWYQWWLEAHGPDGVGNGPMTGCDPKQFSDWRCCPTHRRLKDERQELLNQGGEFGITTGQITSPAWWRAFAEKYDVQLPDDRPFSL